MAKRIDYENIFTPQGLLGKVSKNPNLDFLMNIFNIPRIYGVSGFGNWNVGQHSVAVAFLVLYWAKFNKYEPQKRDKLVTMALLHDAHEAVVGDILPFFKTQEVREAVNTIQEDILKSFHIVEDKDLQKELKLIDMISFLYEIGQSTPFGKDNTKKKLLNEIYKRQKEAVLDYVENENMEKKIVKAFLKELHF